MLVFPQRSQDTEGSTNCMFVDTAAFERDEEGLFRLSGRPGTSGEDDEWALCSVGVEL